MKRIFTLALASVLFCTSALAETKPVVRPRSVICIIVNAVCDPAIGCVPPPSIDCPPPAPMPPAPPPPAPPFGGKF